MKLSGDTRIGYLLARVRHTYCGIILELFCFQKKKFTWMKFENKCVRLVWGGTNNKQTNKQPTTKKKVRYNLGQPHGSVSMAPDVPGALKAQYAGTPTNFFVVFLPFCMNQDKLICCIIWCVKTYTPRKQMGNMQSDSNTTFFNSLLYLICRSTTQLWVVVLTG